MRITGTLCSLTNLVDKVSRYHPSAITAKQLVEFGKRRDESSSYLFLHREIAIRISHMIKELQMLPEGLREQHSVKQVEGMYWKSFEDLAPFSVDGAKDEQNLCKFARRILEIKRRHAKVVETMAQGILALKNDAGDRFDPSINYFLDRFYMSRIAIRVLIANHLTLFGPIEEVPGNCGIIDPNLVVHDIVDEAATTAKYLCNHHYGDSSEINIATYNCKGIRINNNEVVVTYIESHLHHIVFELVKNALRASIENPIMGRVQPIDIAIVEGRRDISIKVSDRGNGIPMRYHNNLFDYHYSTAPEPDKDSHIPPLAGFGYGLPLSRLYARYLNGNLRVMSVEGFGTDAVIYLQQSAEDAGEVLPLFNKTSQAKYQMGTMVQDWNVAGTRTRPIWS